MKRTIILFCTTVLFILLCNRCKEPAGTHREMHAFVSGLMEKMTIGEKIGQINLPSEGDIITGIGNNSNLVAKIRQGQVGGMFNIKGIGKIHEIQRIAVEESRLGIPLLFGMDIIHGYETIFPIPLALAATWDMGMVEESAHIAAVEAGSDGICWTFSPMVDVCRDPRWGRVAEGYGEDPYLNGMAGQAMIRGYQGKDNSFATREQILSCVKHFALYGASEAGRDYNTVDMSRQCMYNYYFPPYKAAVEAGAGSVMASFNVIDYVPAHANRWLLTNVLRNEWGFRGMTIADYGGIGEMISHGLGDLKEVSAQAMNAGLDVDMVTEGYLTTLMQSVREGTVDKARIDEACRRVLETKYRLGLFADPYKYCTPENPKKIYTQAHRDAARRIAAESFVLLKNEGQLLPLGATAKTITVVGPLANTRSNLVGTWSVAADLTAPATVVEGIRTMAGPGGRILYAKGSNLTADPQEEINSTYFGRTLNRDNRTEEELRDEALAAARKADVVIAVLGEASEMTGESSSRAKIGIPDVQQKLLHELLRTGKPIVLVLFTGRPLTLTWEDGHIPAILNVWFGGSETAYAIADVLSGKVNPSGKLTISFPRSVAQIPVYYNHLMTGRPTADKGYRKFRSNYIDERNPPLYPFGYGLSYTQFRYSGVRLSSGVMNRNCPVTASVTVTNTGKYDGKETVQLYLRDLIGSSARPVKELKGFEKISLKAGESRVVTFTIAPEMLKFYNYDLQYSWEPGDFEVMIGPNSRDVKTAKLTMQ